MRQGKPSRTAQFIALNRALGTLAPRVPGFSDPFAVQFLEDKWRKRVERTRAPLTRGARTSPYASWQRPMGTFNQFRTVILDRALASAMPVEQLVILGAGLDSRAWRLDSLRDTTVFEVDFPASQAWKRERAAGFVLTKRSFWLWEGVTMYLPPDVVSANLGAFAALSAPGSRIALTYLRKKNGRIPRNIILTLLGEPLRSAFEPDELTEIAASHGWKRVQDSNIEDWLKETPGLTLTPRQIGVQYQESIWVGEIP